MEKIQADTPCSFRSIEPDALSSYPSTLTGKCITQNLIKPIGFCFLQKKKLGKSGDHFFVCYVTAYFVISTLVVLNILQKFYLVFRKI